MTDQPYTTSNVLLAFALYLAGVPFIDEAKPCLNLYDAETLKNLGFAGMTLEEAARAALATGKKGTVQYLFKLTPELQGLLQTFQAEEKVIAESEGKVVEEARSILDAYKSGEMETDCALVQIACLILKSRRHFIDMWKSRSDLAMIRIPHLGEPKIRDGARGSKIVSSPGYRVISLSASEKTRQHLKL